MRDRGAPAAAAARASSMAPREQRRDRGRRPLPLLLALLCCLVGGARALSISWAAGSGTNLDWKQPTNWSPAVVPGPNDDVTIAAGSATLSIVNINSTANSWTLSSAGGSLSLTTQTTTNQSFATTTAAGTFAITGSVLIFTITSYGNISLPTFDYSLTTNLQMTLACHAACQQVDLASTASPNAPSTLRSVYLAIGGTSISPSPPSVKIGYLGHLNSGSTFSFTNLGRAVEFVNTDPLGGVIPPTYFAGTMAFVSATKLGGIPVYPTMDVNMIGLVWDGPNSGTTARAALYPQCANGQTCTFSNWPGAFYGGFANQGASGSTLVLSGNTNPSTGQQRASMGLPSALIAAAAQPVTTSAGQTVVLRNFDVYSVSGKMPWNGQAGTLSLDSGSNFWVDSPTNVPVSGSLTLVAMSGTVGLTFGGPSGTPFTFPAASLSAPLGSVAVVNLTGDARNVVQFTGAMYRVRSSGRLVCQGPSVQFPYSLQMEVGSRMSIWVDGGNVTVGNSGAIPILSGTIDGLVTAGALNTYGVLLVPNGGNITQLNNGDQLTLGPNLKLTNTLQPFSLTPCTFPKGHMAFVGPLWLDAVFQPTTTLALQGLSGLITFNGPSNRTLFAPSSGYTAQIVRSNTLTSSVLSWLKIGGSGSAGTGTTYTFTDPVSYIYGDLRVQGTIALKGLTNTVLQIVPGQLFQANSFGAGATVTMCLPTLVVHAGATFTLVGGITWDWTCADPGAVARQLIGRGATSTFTTNSATILANSVYSTAIQISGFDPASYNSIQLAQTSGDSTLIGSGIVALLSGAGGACVRGTLSVADGAMFYAGSPLWAAANTAALTRSPRNVATGTGAFTGSILLLNSYSFTQAWDVLSDGLAAVSSYSLSIGSPNNVTHSPLWPNGLTLTAEINGLLYLNGPSPWEFDFAGMPYKFNGPQLYQVGGPLVTMYGAPQCLGSSCGTPALAVANAPGDVCRLYGSKSAPLGSTDTQVWSNTVVYGYGDLVLDNYAPGASGSPPIAYQFAYLGCGHPQDPTTFGRVLTGARVASVTAVEGSMCGTMMSTAPADPDTGVVNNNWLPVTLGQVGSSVMTVDTGFVMRRAQGNSAVLLLTGATAFDLPHAYSRLMLGDGVRVTGGVAYTGAGTLKLNGCDVEQGRSNLDARLTVHGPDMGVITSFMQPYATAAQAAERWPLGNWTGIVVVRTGPVDLTGSWLGGSPFAVLGCGNNTYSNNAVPAKFPTSGTVYGTIDTNSTTSVLRLVNTAVTTSQSLLFSGTGTIGTPSNSPLLPLVASFVSLQAGNSVITGFGCILAAPHFAGPCTLTGLSVAGTATAGTADLSAAALVAPVQMTAAIISGGSRNLVWTTGPAGSNIALSTFTGLSATLLVQAAPGSVSANNNQIQFGAFNMSNTNSGTIRLGNVTLSVGGIQGYVAGSILATGSPSLVQLSGVSRYTGSDPSVALVVGTQAGAAFSGAYLQWVGGGGAFSVVNHNTTISFAGLYGAGGAWSFTANGTQAPCTLSLPGSLTSTMSVSAFNGAVISVVGTPFVNDGTVVADGTGAAVRFSASTTAVTGTGKAWVEARNGGVVFFLGGGVTYGGTVRAAGFGSYVLFVLGLTPSFGTLLCNVTNGGRLDAGSMQGNGGGNGNVYVSVDGPGSMLSINNQIVSDSMISLTNGGTITAGVYTAQCVLTFDSTSVVAVTNNGLLLASAQITGTGTITLYPGGRIQGPGTLCGASATQCVVQMQSGSGPLPRIIGSGTGILRIPNLYFFASSTLLLQTNATSIQIPGYLTVRSGVQAVITNDVPNLSFNFGAFNLQGGGANVIFNATAAIGNPTTNKYTVYSQGPSVGWPDNSHVSIVHPSVQFQGYVVFACVGGNASLCTFNAANGAVLKITSITGVGNVNLYPDVIVDGFPAAAGGQILPYSPGGVYFPGSGTVYMRFLAPGYQLRFMNLVLGSTDGSTQILTEAASSFPGLLLLETPRFMGFPAVSYGLINLQLGTDVIVSGGSMTGRIYCAVPQGGDPCDVTFTGASADPLNPLGVTVTAASDASLTLMATTAGARTLRLYGNVTCGSNSGSYGWMLIDNAQLMSNLTITLAGLNNGYSQLALGTYSASSSVVMWPNVNIVRTAAAGAPGGAAGVVMRQCGTLTAYAPSGVINVNWQQDRYDGSYPVLLNVTGAGAWTVGAPAYPGQYTGEFFVYNMIVNNPGITVTVYHHLATQTPQYSPTYGNSSIVTYGSDVYLLGGGALYAPFTLFAVAAKPTGNQIVVLDVTNCTVFAGIPSTQVSVSGANGVRAVVQGTGLALVEANAAILLGVKRAQDPLGWGALTTVWDGASAWLKVGTCAPGSTLTLGPSTPWTSGNSITSLGGTFNCPANYSGSVNMAPTGVIVFSQTTRLNTGCAITGTGGAMGSGAGVRVPWGVIIYPGTYTFTGDWMGPQASDPGTTLTIVTDTNNNVTFSGNWLWSARPSARFLVMNGPRWVVFQGALRVPPQVSSYLYLQGTASVQATNVNNVVGQVQVSMQGTSSAPYPQDVFGNTVFSSNVVYLLQTAGQRLVTCTNCSVTNSGGSPGLVWSTGANLTSASSFWGDATGALTLDGCVVQANVQFAPTTTPGSSYTLYGPVNGDTTTVYAPLTLPSFDVWAGTLNVLGQGVLTLVNAQLAQGSNALTMVNGTSIRGSIRYDTSPGATQYVMWTNVRVGDYDTLYVQRPITIEANLWLLDGTVSIGTNATLLLDGVTNGNTLYVNLNGTYSVRQYTVGLGNGIATYGTFVCTFGNPFADPAAVAAGVSGPTLQFRNGAALGIYLDLRGRHDLATLDFGSGTYLTAPNAPVLSSFGGRILGPLDGSASPLTVQGYGLLDLPRMVFSGTIVLSDTTSLRIRNATGLPGCVVKGGSTSNPADVLLQFDNGSRFDACNVQVWGGGTPYSTARLVLTGVALARANTIQLVYRGNFAGNPSNPYPQVYLTDVSVSGTASSSGLISQQGCDFAGELAPNGCTVVVQGTLNVQSDVTEFSIRGPYVDSVTGLPLVGAFTLAGNGTIAVASATTSVTLYGTRVLPSVSWVTTQTSGNVQFFDSCALVGPTSVTSGGGTAGAGGFTNWQGTLSTFGSNGLRITHSGTAVPGTFVLAPRINVYAPLVINTTNVVTGGSVMSVVLNNVNVGVSADTKTAVYVAANSRAPIDSVTFGPGSTVYGVLDRTKSAPGYWYLQGANVPAGHTLTVRSTPIGGSGGGTFDSYVSVNDTRTPMNVDGTLVLVNSALQPPLTMTGTGVVDVSACNVMPVGVLLRDFHGIVRGPNATQSLTLGTGASATEFYFPRMDYSGTLNVAGNVNVTFASLVMGSNVTTWLTLGSQAYVRVGNDNGVSVLRGSVGTTGVSAVLRNTAGAPIVGNLRFATGASTLALDGWWGGTGQLQLDGGGPSFVRWLNTLYVNSSLTVTGPTQGFWLYVDVPRVMPPLPAWTGGTVAASDGGGGPGALTFVPGTQVGGGAATCTLTCTGLSATVRGLLTAANPAMPPPFTMSNVAIDGGDTLTLTSLSTQLNTGPSTPIALAGAGALLHLYGGALLGFNAPHDEYVYGSGTVWLDGVFVASAVFTTGKNVNSPAVTFRGPDAGQETSIMAGNTLPTLVDVAGTVTLTSAASGSSYVNITDLRTRAFSTTAALRMNGARMGTSGVTVGVYGTLSVRVETPDALAFDLAAPVAVTVGTGAALYIDSADATAAHAPLVSFDALTLNPNATLSTGYGPKTLGRATVVVRDWTVYTSQWFGGNVTLNNVYVSVAHMWRVLSSGAGSGDQFVTLLRGSSVTVAGSGAQAVYATVATEQTRVRIVGVDPTSTVERVYFTGSSPGILVDADAFAFPSPAIALSSALVTFETCVSLPPQTGAPAIDSAHVVFSPPPFCNYSDAFNGCQSQPCIASQTAQCVSLQSSWQCLCQPGYTGVICQTDINECASSPCTNGGTCSDGVNKFTCACPLTWTGVRCQLDVNECATNNGGCGSESTCINLPGDWLCSPYILQPTVVSPDATLLVPGGSDNANQWLFPGLRPGFMITLSFASLKLSLSQFNVSVGPLGSPWRFPCAPVTQTGNFGPLNQTLSCKLPAVGGTALHVFFLYGGSVVSTSNATFGVPPPTITGGTLQQNATNPNGPSTHMYMDNTLPTAVQFLGSNFFGLNVALMNVTFGPAANPSKFTCTVIPAYASDTMITCVTDVLAAGINNVFRVDVAGQVVIGSDLLDFPVVPIVSSVSGCNDQGLATVNCPTSAVNRTTGRPILLTIVGQNFQASATVNVGTRACSTNVTITDTQITCALPVGLGALNKIAVRSGGKPSAVLDTIFVSYATQSISSLQGCAADNGTTLSIVDCPRSGGATITVLGDNFGVSGAGVLVGSQLCTNTRHDPSDPHRNLTCTIPAGNKLGLPVLVIQAGTISKAPAGEVSYRQCVPGTVANGLSCDDCIAGSVSQSYEAQQCVQCTAGEYSGPAPSTLCRPCPAGQVTFLNGQVSCTNCTQGQTSHSGDQQCTPCQAGKYATVSTGATECAPCAAGSQQPTFGQTHCDLCQPGYANGNDGQPLCTQCEAGKFSNITGAQTCTACPRATFQGLPGKTSCTPCPPGTGGANTGQQQCTTCELGQVARVDGTCEDCPAGTYQPNVGVPCRVCAAGSASLARSDHCTACTQGFMAPREGMETCAGCPLHSRSNLLNTICDCDIGFYATTNDEHMQCEPCPAGPDCTAAGQTVQSLVTEAGYWRSDNNSLAFYQCLRASDCLAGGCEAHRTGPLCSVCEHGYRADTTGSGCSPCPTQSAAVGGSIGFTILLIAALLVVFALIWQSGGDFVPKFDPWKVVKNYRPEKRVPPSYTFNAKLLIGYLQVATSLLSLVDIPWPSYFLTFVHYFDFINLDFVPWGSVECVASLSFYDKLVLYAVIPPVVLLLLAAVPTLILYVQQKRNFDDNSEVRNQYKLNRRKIIKLVVFALFLMYPTVSSRVLSFFVCRNVNGVSYLAADFHLECHTDEWYRYVPLAVACIVVYPVGIPLALFMAVFVNRHRLNLPTTKLAYGLIYEAYTPQLYWFEVADLVEKLWLTSLLQFLSVDAICGVGMAVIFVFLSTVLVATPFVRRMDDRLSLFIQIQLMLILCMGLTLRTAVDGLRPGSVEDVAASVVLLVVLFLLVVMFLYHGLVFVRGYIRNYQRRKAKAAAADMTNMHDLNTTAGGGGKGGGVQMHAMHDFTSTTDSDTNLAGASSAGGGHSSMQAGGRNRNSSESGAGPYGDGVRRPTVGGGASVDKTDPYALRQAGLNKARATAHFGNKAPLGMVDPLVVVDDPTVGVTPTNRDGSSGSVSGRDASGSVSGSATPMAGRPPITSAAYSVPADVPMLAAIVGSGGAGAAGAFGSHDPLAAAAAAADAAASAGGSSSTPASGAADSPAIIAPAPGAFMALPSPRANAEPPSVTPPLLAEPTLAAATVAAGGAAHAAAATPAHAFVDIEDVPPPPTEAPQLSPLHGPGAAGTPAAATPAAAGTDSAPQSTTARQALFTFDQAGAGRAAGGSSSTAATPAAGSGPSSDS